MDHPVEVRYGPVLIVDDISETRDHLAKLLGFEPDIEVVGAASSGAEAIELAARTEGIFLDPVYTSKAMAGLIAYVRQQRFPDRQTVLFWHTGGQPGLFA